MPQLLENKMFLRFNNLSSPEDVITGGGETTDLNADSILEALNESAENREDDETLPDGEETPDTEVEEKDKKKKDDTKDDEDELKELEEELKTPTDEDLELKTPVQRRALMKDYPDIFKKHPGLESTIYRERAYTELLPTINDAKEALAAAQVLQRFESDLMEGQTVDMMKAVLAEDPKAFAKLADNYMDNLAQVDERAYHHVLGNITKDIVTAMFKFGKEKEDTDIQDAASTLYQFMFNSTKWEGKKKLSADTVVDDATAKKEAELNERERKIEEGRYKEHTSKLMTSIDNQVKGTIEKTIDPKDQMSSFVKTKAIEEVLNKATKLIEKDGRFQQIVKQLTDKAAKEKFTEESLNRIKSAYFVKYKAILLPIVKAVRNEALKGASARLKKDEEINDTTERANRDKPQSDRNKSGNNQDASKPKPGESSLDFLLRRANK